MSSNGQLINIYISKESQGTNTYSNVYSGKPKRIFVKLNSSTTGIIQYAKKAAVGGDTWNWNDAYSGEVGKIYIKLNYDADLSTTPTGIIQYTKKVIDGDAWNNAYSGEIGKSVITLSSKSKGEIHISTEEQGSNNYTILNVPDGEFVRIFERIEPKPEPDTQPTIQPLTFAAVGDTNCTNDAKKCFAAIKAANVGFFLALGDFSYGSSQQCWIDLCETLGSELFPNNIYPMIGNHDDIEDGSAQHRTDIINAFPHMPKDGWYTITKGNMRIIILDTQKDYTNPSSQFTFAKNALEAAKNDSAIRWIVVCYHKPSIATADGDHDGLADLRDDYHPLFDQYGVDLVFAGHRHSYTRTKPVNYKTASPFYTIKVDNANGPYTNPGGTIFITNGSGGRNRKPNSSDEPFVAHANDSDFGVVICELSNQGKNLTGKFISNNGGQVVDEWVINKP